MSGILILLRLETQLLNNFDTDKVAIAEAALVVPNNQSLVKVVYNSTEAILSNLNLVRNVSRHYQYRIHVEESRILHYQQEAPEHEYLPPFYQVCLLNFEFMFSLLVEKV